MSTNVFSGARAIFKIDNKKIAFGFQLEPSEEVMYEAVDVLDNIETQEHVPVGYRVGFTCGIFRTIRGVTGATEPKPIAEPRQGVHGSIKEMGIFPSTQNILTSGVLTCTLTDRLTGKTLMSLQEAKCSNNNYSVTARGITGQNLSFVAIRIKDESEQA